MKVYKYPQIKVAIEKEKGKTDVYIFYEMNAPEGKYSWYKQIGIKQKIAIAIAKKLKKITAV